MNHGSSAPGNDPRPTPDAQETGDGFHADLPLAILESVRTHDRPAEVLEDEDLTISLPRRLGLTGVIETQIYRYQAAQKAGAPYRVFCDGREDRPAGTRGER